MRRYVDHQEQVSGLAARWRPVALPLQAQASALAAAGRNFHPQGARRAIGQRQGDLPLAAQHRFVK